MQLLQHRLAPRTCEGALRRQHLAQSPFPGQHRFSSEPFQERVEVITVGGPPRQLWTSVWLLPSCRVASVPLMIYRPFILSTTHTAMAVFRTQSDPSRMCTFVQPVSPFRPSTPMQQQVPSGPHECRVSGQPSVSAHGLAHPAAVSRTSTTRSERPWPNVTGTRRNRLLSGLKTMSSNPHTTSSASRIFGLPFTTRFMMRTR